MITGAHFVMFSTWPEADRAFFHDVLRFRSVDAGGGWLIFALPPAEVGVHPAEVGARRRKTPAGSGMAKVDLYLMCNDLHALIKSLLARNVKCTEIEEARWGLKTTILLPSGSEIGLYQPNHSTAIAGTRKKVQGSRREPGKSKSGARRRAR